MFNWGSLIFMVELVVAQNVLLYACPKRKNFVIKAILSALICLALALFFPSSKVLKIPYNYQPLYQLVRMLVLTTYSVVGVHVCYDLSLRKVFALCMAGYAIQHICYHVASLLLFIPGARAFAYTNTFANANKFEFIVFPVLYFVIWLVLGRGVAKNQYHKNSDVRLDVISLVVIFICVGLSRVSYAFNEHGSFTNSLYAIVCCCLALSVQFVVYRMLAERYEKQMVEYIWQEDKKQLEHNKSTIDALNIKAHDLKFKLREMGISKEERKEILNLLDAYDGIVRSGNDVLDVIMADHVRLCTEQGIKFTFMGSGADLGFMKDADLYSLVGNALENAREAVMKLDNPDKKIITFTLSQKGSFFDMDFTNYFKGDLVFEDDGLATSKDNSEGLHGFGIKSMKLIAKKYGGDVRISVKDGLFSLGVFLVKN